MTIFLWFSSWNNSNRQLHSTTNPLLVVFSGNIVFISKSWIPFSGVRGPMQILDMLFKILIFRLNSFNLPRRRIGSFLGEKLNNIWYRGKSFHDIIFLNLDVIRSLPDLETEDCCWCSQSQCWSAARRSWRPPPWQTSPGNSPSNSSSQLCNFSWNKKIITMVIC